MNKMIIIALLQTSLISTTILAENFPIPLSSSDKRPDELILNFNPKIEIITEHSSENHVSSVTTPVMAVPELKGYSRRQLVVGGMLIGYGIVLYQVKTLERYIRSDDCWGDWRKLTDLYSLKDEKLVEDLLRLTQRRYLDVSDPVNKFLSDLKVESESLTKYENLCYYIKKVPILNRLFFINEELLNSVSNRKQCVEFLINKMLNWVVDERINR